MIKRAFNIYDHPKLLKLKVRYTLDNPYTSREREQLADLIYDLLYAKRTTTPVQKEEWETLLDSVQLSPLTVREWLEQNEDQVKGAA